MFTLVTKNATAVPERCSKLPSVRLIWYSAKCRRWGSLFVGASFHYSPPFEGIAFYFRFIFPRFGILRELR